MYETDDAESIDVVIGKLEALGIPTYGVNEAIYAEELESADNVSGFSPTHYTKLPYNINFSEIANGNVVASKYYFYGIDKPVTLTFNTQAINNLGKNVKLKTTLYREKSSWAGASDKWEKVNSFNYEFGSTFVGQMPINNLDSSYIYCLTFENASDFDCTVSGAVNIAF